MSLDESLPVANLYAENMLNELASLLYFRHREGEKDLLALAPPDHNAGSPEHHGML